MNLNLANIGASAKAHRICRSFAKRITFVLCAVVICLGLSTPETNAQPNCIPLAQGVPALPGPPIWWDEDGDANFPELPGENDQRDDPRWRGATSITYGSGTAGQAEFRALYDTSYLYLSWHLRVDPTLENGQDVIYIGFASPSGTPSSSEPDVIIKITPFNSTALPLQADPAYATTTILRTSPGGSWSAVSTEPPWLASHMRVWLTNEAPYSWAVHMRVPRITGASATIPNDGIKINSTTGNFKMWYEFQMDTAGGLVKYNWPRTVTTTDTGVPGVFDYPHPDTWGEFHLKTGPSDPTVCSNIGVKLVPGNIGTTNPVSSEIKYNLPGPENKNTFYARPENNSGSNIPIAGIRANFRIANWGSLPNRNDVPDPSLLWTDIPGTEMGIPNDAVILNGTLGNITFDWTVEDPFLANLDSGQMRPHQCVLVELSSGLPLMFVNNSVYRNMDFVSASKFERDAEISIVNLPPIASGGPKRDVYLYVETLNMPAYTGRDEQDGLANFPDDPSGDIERRNNLNSMLAEGKLTSEQIDQIMPTYRVHVYHDTGQRTSVNRGVNHPILRPQSSFGYYVNHEGKPAGWEHRLKGVGLIEIAPHFYKIAVPNDGATTVTTVIEAIELGPFALNARVGADFPHSSFNNLVDPGVSLNVGLEYLFSNTFSTEAIFGYHRFSDNGLGSDLDIYQFSLNARYYYFTTKRAGLFGNAGSGLYVLDPGDTEFGFNVGAGWQYDLSARTALEAAYNYHYVNNSNLDPEFSTLQVGLRYRF